MVWIVLLFGFFLYLALSPFLPKERGSAPVVIHNNIHITNNPKFTNTHSAQSQEVPKHESSEEGLFGRIRL